VKIAFDLNLSTGPTGGGISFLGNLASKLIASGHKVYFDLCEKDLDFIIIMDPRWNHSNRAFNSRGILRYISAINPKAIVIHRINECDERKNSHSMNKKLRQINYLADATVYVGSWLMDLKLTNPLSFHDLDIVIRNGVDKSIFNNESFQPWLSEGPLKLVTHHWSSNRMKGFDIYEELDLLLGQEEFKSRFSFTYIGNLPKNFKFKNSVHIEPLHGVALAMRIKEHHGYITASINEPGGNHQSEGAGCGLPLLYRNSGCLPEYCDGFGVMFDESNFKTKLIEYRNTYNDYVGIMNKFPNTADTMVDNYLKYFELLLKKRDFIRMRRSLSKVSLSAVRLSFPI
jgi:hypothetical protein